MHAHTSAGLDMGMDMHTGSAAQHEDFYNKFPFFPAGPIKADLSDTRLQASDIDSLSNSLYFNSPLGSVGSSPVKQKNYQF